MAGKNASIGSLGWNASVNTAGLASDLAKVEKMVDKTVAKTGKAAAGIGKTTGGAAGAKAPNSDQLTGVGAAALGGQGGQLLGFTKLGPQAVALGAAFMGVKLAISKATADAEEALKDFKTNTETSASTLVGFGGVMESLGQVTNDTVHAMEEAAISLLDDTIWGGNVEATRKALEDGKRLDKLREASLASGQKEQKARAEMSEMTDEEANKLVKQYGSLSKAQEALAEKEKQEEKLAEEQLQAIRAKMQKETDARADIAANLGEGVKITDAAAKALKGQFGSLSQAKASASRLLSSETVSFIRDEKDAADTRRAAEALGVEALLDLPQAIQTSLAPSAEYGTQAEASLRAKSSEAIQKQQSEYLRQIAARLQVQKIVEF